MTKTTKKTTATNRKQSTIISIKAPAQGAPPKLLANAELTFTTGLLQGLRLTGIALWRAEQATTGRRFVAVTFPARQVEGPEGFRYHDHVRGMSNDVKRLKAAVVSAYREFAAAEGHDVPEDVEAAA
jgi:hypothetical protein